MVNSSSLRILFALAVKKSYHLYTYDVKTAFLYGELDEDIYMFPPEGFNCSNKICKLQKSLYGLKQTPLKWNQRFSTFLKKKDLEPLKTGQCIYVKRDRTLILAFYVDDGILLGKNLSEMNQMIEDLEKEFEITVDRNPKSFLGMEIRRSPGKIKLTQKNYSLKILKQYKMNESKPVNTPLVGGEIPDEGCAKINYPYREAMGSLLYLTTKTRLDLAQAVRFGSRHVSNPRNRNLTDLKRILNGTRSCGISFERNGDDIDAYCDSDYAGDPEIQKSTTGYVIFYCGGPVNWCSRKQPIVATSSTEAEYIAAAECCKEIMYLKSLVEELLNETVKVNLKLDNQSAIKLVKNGVINRR
jgi:hypothetical protein